MRDIDKLAERGHQKQSDMRELFLKSLEQKRQYPENRTHFATIKNTFRDSDDDNERDLGDHVLKSKLAGKYGNNPNNFSMGGGDSSGSD